MPIVPMRHVIGAIFGILGARVFKNYRRFHCAGSLLYSHHLSKDGTLYRILLPTSWPLAIFLRL